MIQRIQSVYLLAAAVILIMILILPIATLVNAHSDSFTYLFYGIVDSEGQIALQAFPLATLLVIMPIISLISIFLYKKRILQMRLCIYNILLMLGSIGLILFYSFQAKNNLFTETIFSFPIVLPVVTAILTYLAFRGIRKDEILVKSIDRIR